MSESYLWVNVDKKEYLHPCDFGCGDRDTESCGRDYEITKALKALLASDWKNCRLIWLGDGDDTFPQSIAHALFATSCKQGTETCRIDDVVGTVYDTYKNISGLFKEAEPKVRDFIEGYLADIKLWTDIVNEYGVDIANPYGGLFLREGRSYKYTINRTKNICYCFEKTKIIYKDGFEADWVDPLPFLLGYGGTLSPGKWLGDIIDVADEIDDSVQIMESYTLPW